MDWKKRTVTYSELRHQLYSGPDDIATIVWLKQIGIVPSDHVQRHGVRTVTPSMTSEKIPAGALAELAWDFDADGGGTIREFVDSLAFELKDHPRKQAVSEILSSLGNDREEELE